jgi:hypothetical protein
MGHAMAPCSGPKTCHDLVEQGDDFILVIAAAELRGLEVLVLDRRHGQRRLLSAMVLIQCDACPREESVHLIDR